MAALRYSVILLLLLITALGSVAQSDTLRSDTLQAPADPIDDPVYYSADDSMRLDIPNQIIYLFGGGVVQYQDIELKADYIEFSFEDKVVTARYITDSLGNKLGKPEFTDGKEDFTADEIRYNFDTEKGVIKNVRTQVTEGYIDATVMKKDTGDIIYISDGRFCPCEDPDARTKFRIKKLKVMDELIVSGPGYLEIAGIPTPLAFPFGFFPNKKKQAAGIIIPQYGESPFLGFFLQGGGYYWPVNDYFDTQFLGDIYSRGSWGLKNISNYNVRYKYNGRFEISYTELKFGDSEFPDFRRETSFFVRWKHIQDPKARPNTRFSADVNFGSVDNFQNNFNTSVNDYLTNTFNSSISYALNFPGKPFNLGINARHSQNSNTQIVNITLPDVSFNVNRFYPLEKVGASKGKRYWFQKIGVTWRMDATNQINVHDSLLTSQYQDELLNSMRNGLRHSATINTSLKLFKGKATLTPSFVYNGRIYFDRIERSWDNNQQEVVEDTLGGVYYNQDARVNATFSSKIYGFFGFKKGKIHMIRHVITPQVTLSYRPDFGTSITGYYGAGGTLSSYSPYQYGVYGVSPDGPSGLVSYNLINAFDMKVRTPNDTSGNAFKKVSLIDNFSIQGGYDMMKDSLRFTTIRTNVRTTILKNLSLNWNAVMDPYYNNGPNRLNRSEFSETGRLLRMLSSNFAAGFRLQSQRKTSATPTIDPDEAEEQDMQEANNLRVNPDAYVDFSVPWTLNMGYTFNVRRSFNTLTDSEGLVSYEDTLLITNSINVSGDMNLTEKWKIGFNTFYDITAKSFGLTNISVYRDLNCWEMAFDWIPFGPRRSYTITINLKSSLLKDLRLQRRRNWFDNAIF